MVEVTALEVALSRILTVGHSLNPTEICLPIGLDSCGIDLGGVEHPLDVLDSISRVRVGGQPLRHLSSATALADPVQGLKDLGHPSNVIVVVQRVAEAGLVGLVLGVTAVFQEENTESCSGDLTEFGDVGRENTADP